MAKLEYLSNNYYIQFDIEMCNNLKLVDVV